MNSIDVIGGVYGERCAFPDWNEVYGSAGRAAAGIAPHVEKVRLHTILPPAQENRVAPIFESFGVEVKIQTSEQFIGFEYLHCLAEPKISPHPSAILTQPTFHVEAEAAILFGMMECSPTVDTEYCVYDPQSPGNPKGFRESGSKAKHLAFVANAREIELLTGMCVEDGACHLLASENAEVVVVKDGLRGAQVFDATGKVGDIPAFETQSVFTVGSGDVFVAAFALAWSIERKTIVEAATYASKAAAQYIETSALPIQSIEDAKLAAREPIILKGGQVYLAGPFRELGQRILVDEARKILKSLGMSVFSPVHDIGHGPAEIVVQKDLQALKGCDVVLAVLNGSSPGTVFEVGYAAALGKPIFCIAQNMRGNDMKLPVGVGCTVHSDFISSLHFLAWRK